MTDSWIQQVVANDFLTQTYYGNTVISWLTTLSIIVASILGGRFLYWVLKNWVGALTRRTKTRLDDIILDMLEEPLTYMFVITGILYSTTMLDLQEVTSHRIQFVYDFLITLSIAWLLARLYDAIHQEYIAPLASKTATDLDDNLLPILRKGVKAIIWAIGLLIALNNAGYDVTTVLAGLGIGGIAFALAIQHTFGNLIGGLNIFVDQHFKVGDRIQLKGGMGTIDGVVEEIGLRTTRIRSRYEGRRVSVPNSVLVSTEVVNVDSENGRQVFQTYKLAPDTAPETVELLLTRLKELVLANPDTKHDLVVSGLVSISDISIEIMLLYWVRPDAKNLPTRTAVNLAVLRLFKELDVRFTDRSQHQYQIQALY